MSKVDTIDFHQPPRAWPWNNDQFCLVHKLVPKLTAEKQKYSEQNSVFRLRSTIYWANLQSTVHHIHYHNCFSWKPYEVGIASRS